MKGGVARRHVVINVGNHGRGVVTGNLSAGGQPLVGVLVTSENGKYCYSDTDGNYALNDLTVAAHTLTALAAQTLRELREADRKRLKAFVG